MDNAQGIYCTKCGKLNQATGMRLCYNCGASLLPPPPQSAKTVEASWPSPVATVEEPAAATRTTTTSTASKNESLPPPPIFTPPAPPPYTPTQKPWSPPPPPSSFPSFGSPPQYRGPGSYGTQRVPVAPNGMPYAVLDNPHGFYPYKNDEEKQVYAVVATFAQRAAGALIDGVIMGLVLFVLVIPFSTNVDTQAVRNGDMSSTGLTDANGILTSTGLTLTVVWSLLTLAYTVILTAMYGRTLGHRVVGIKVIKLNGHRPDWNTALIRNLFGYCFWLGNVLSAFSNPFLQSLGVMLAFMVLIGFALTAFAEKKRGWHDKLAGTVVVNKDELVKDVNF